MTGAALVAASIALVAPPARAAVPGTASLRGQILDPSGAGVPEARVEVTGEGSRRVARSDGHGGWALGGLKPGTYTVLVTRAGFAAAAQSGVTLLAGRETSLDTALVLETVKEDVVVDEPTGVGLSEEQSAGTIVIEGQQLEALPDDPDELLEALQALAGSAAGPNGGQVFVDGFSGGRLPPKASIRLIRLNASPFSAEYDRPGFGRIEILTKPGGDSFRGQGQGRFNDAALNTKDPYATSKPDYRRLTFGGNVGGPLVKGKASFVVDFERRSIDDARLVNATVLGPGFSLEPYNQTFVVPQARTTVSPRLDAQLGSVHTLTLRYSYTSSDQTGTGIGGFALPQRAYDATSAQHVLQAGDTMVFGKVVNELRAQWSRQTRGQLPADLEPALLVQDAFSSGGADVGLSSSRQDHFELHDVTSWTVAKHSLRAGLRLRNGSERDDSRQGYNGSVTFAGTFGPQLDGSGNLVLGPDGRPVVVPVTSLERYRRTLWLGSLGLSPQQIRALGGGASQLQISGGDPVSSVGQWDVAAFVQDDWKPSSNLTLGLGLRYEAQTNMSDGRDIAPRLSLAWSPGHSGRGTPQTVVRAGLGVFYDRVDDALTLEARRLDGSAPRRYLVSDPALLDQVTFDASGAVASLPSFDALTDSAQPSVVRRLAPDLRAPATLQGSLGIDRALPGNLTLNASWIHSNTWRALRSRVLSAAAASGAVYQYESTGHVRQDELIVGLNRRFDQRVSLSARYFLSWLRSDTDGAGSFPADSSNPAADWGRASADVRQRFLLMGSVTLPGDVRVSPFLLASTGAPYNITAGRDLNGDTVFNDRPAFASSASLPGVVQTPWGLLDPTPRPGEAIVPRNLGQAPGFFSMNLRVGRTIRLRGTRGAAGGPREPDGPGGPGGAGPGGPGVGPGGPGMGPGGPEGPGGGFGGWRGRGGRGESSGPELTVSLYAQNLLNRKNAGAPIGNLSSPSFGQSLSGAGGFGRGGGGGIPSAGNRSVELQIRASF